jgi:hypothetical protein
MNTANSYPEYRGDSTMRERVERDARRQRAQAVNRYITTPVMGWIASTVRAARGLAAYPQSSRRMQCK